MAKLRPALWISPCEAYLQRPSGASASVDFAVAAKAKALQVPVKGLLYRMAAVARQDKHRDCVFSALEHQRTQSYGCEGRDIGGNLNEKTCPSNHRNACSRKHRWLRQPASAGSDQGVIAI
jgi:hypothetical protein